MLQSGTLLQERFLIEERIGLGGMGAVYRATDQKFGSRVAIKETFYDNRELADAFEREARLLNSLHHPVLPHVSDYFSEGDDHFLVMEYIEGEDLSEMLKRGETLPSDDVIRWTFELLDALDYLHSQDPPIIHRDIKPNNLKVTTRGNIVLLDFGLAKETSGNTLGMHSVFGYSRRYSPLEQIEGTGTDTRSDLFALGATVFHLLTGQPPVDVLARASAIVAGRPDPLEPADQLNNSVPSDFANVIHSALALNAELRFASARAMRNALEHALGMDTTDPVDAVSAPAAVSTGSDTAGAEPDESFEALDAFRYTTGPSPVREEDKPFEGEEPVAEILSAGAAKPHLAADVASYRNGRRPVLWFAAMALIISIFSYGLYRVNSVSSETSDDASHQEPVIDTSAEEKAVEPALEEPAEKSPPLALEVPEERPAKSVDSKPRPDEEEPKIDASKTREPVKAETPPKARTEQRSPRRTAARTDSRPARNEQYDRPAVSDIEMIMTGIPSEPYRRNEWRRRRQWEEDDYRRRQQRRNRRAYPE